MNETKIKSTSPHPVILEIPSQTPFFYTVNQNTVYQFDVSLYARCQLSKIPQLGVLAPTGREVHQQYQRPRKSVCHRVPNQQGRKHQDTALWPIRGHFLQLSKLIAIVSSQHALIAPAPSFTINVMCCFLQNNAEGVVI